MNTNRTLNVFIASPGDIVVERKIVNEVCLGLNESDLLNHLRVSIHTAVWEDIFSSAERVPEIINRLIEECDIFVCILYKRFDFPSSRTETETLNEFLSAYDSWKSLKKPHFMFFFKEVKVSSIEDVKDPHLSKVLELKENIEKEKKLHVDGFSAPYEFCEKIFDHVEKWVRENANKH